MGRKLIDRLGHRYGTLTVIARVPGSAGVSKWLCRCDCGNEKEIHSSNFRNIKTCDHARITHGMKSHPLYPIWISMMARCTNPSNAAYDRYGGRGIKVCERWAESPANFIQDMGPRPEGLSLERLDNNGNYEPDNCVWATRAEQASNRRSNVIVDGMILKEYCAKHDLNYAIIVARRSRGWTTERAIKTPVLPQKARNQPQM